VQAQDHAQELDSKKQLALEPADKSRKELAQDLGGRKEQGQELGNKEQVQERCNKEPEPAQVPGNKTELEPVQVPDSKKEPEPVQDLDNKKPELEPVQDLDNRKEQAQEHDEKGGKWALEQVHPRHVQYFQWWQDRRNPDAG